MRLTIDLLRYVAGHINTIRQREITLRGYQIPAIENLGILQDAYDCIDLSDNSIIIMNNFPIMKRLNTLLLHNNKIKQIVKGLGQYLLSLENLMLTNNKIEKLSDLDGLSEFTNLLRLNLMDNPVCKQDGYRLYIIAQCPKLKHLDFKKIKISERANAEKMWGHKIKLKKNKKSAINKVNKAKTVSKSNKNKNKNKNKKNQTNNRMDIDDGVNDQNNNNNINGDLSMSNGVNNDVKLTKSQIEILKKAITSAQTSDEIDKLEKILKSGRIPVGDWKKLADKHLQ